MGKQKSQRGVGSLSGRLLTRRQLIKTSVLGSLFLTAAPLFSKRIFASNSSVSYQFLTKEDVILLKSYFPAVMNGSLPSQKDEQEKVIDNALVQVDYYISGLSLSLQAEVRQGLDLLNLAPARILLAGLWSRWEEASVEDLEEVLNSWRDSSFSLKKGLYLFVQSLIHIGWYASSDSWAYIGYPGPPEFTIRPEGEKHL